MKPPENFGRAAVEAFAFSQYETLGFYIPYIVFIVVYYFSNRINDFITYSHHYYKTRYPHDT